MIYGWIPWFNSHDLLVIHGSPVDSQTRRQVFPHLFWWTQDRDSAQGPAFQRLGAHLHDAARRAVGRRLGAGSLLCGLHAGDAAHLDRQLSLGESPGGVLRSFFFGLFFFGGILRFCEIYLVQRIFRVVWLDLTRILVGFQLDLILCLTGFFWCFFVGIGFLKSWHGIHPKRLYKLIWPTKMHVVLSSMLGFQACASLTTGTKYCRRK